MDVCCDLEVDVNGEGSFMVDKKILSSYSGRLEKLFGKSQATSTTRNLKLIFHDFPGGAKIFEQIARFCYNKSIIDINHTNLTLLHSAAHFMEMNKSSSGTENLIEKLEKSLEEIRYWTWSDLLSALKKNQDSAVDIHSSVVLRKCLDTLVGRLALATETSPCPSTSSPDSFMFRISCDSRSTESLKTSCSRATWWFEDLLVLNDSSVEMAIKSLVSQKFDHGIISKFLFHYLKSKIVHAQVDEKCKIIEMVIKILYSLDHWSISYKGLLGVLRISLNMKLSKCTRSKLEGMIGLRMDEASLDNLLIPSPFGVNYLYDVNLVLRFLKSFLSIGLAKISNDRVTKVVSLLDLYLAEVAPDPCLKPSKFIALSTALPDSFRNSCDELYHAIDMYLEVHTDLSEEETFLICSALNYEKLSQEACIHLAKNRKFPSRSSVKALLSQQAKLKNLILDANYSKSSSSSPSDYLETGLKDESSEQIVLYSGKLEVITENDKLRTQLQGMQSRVNELENVCRKMQSQMVKMMKSKSSTNLSARSLPKLCQ